jgi:thimet oligopeptidase
LIASLHGRLGLAALVALFAALPAESARPQVPLLDADGVTRECESGLARARKALDAMRAKRGPRGIFDGWNRLDILTEETLNPLYLLNSVHPDKAVRDAAEPCLQEYVALQTEIYQDEKLFRRVDAARPSNARQAKLRKDLLEKFEDSGVALPPAKRKRATEIFDRIELLRQEYDKSVNEDPTRVTFTPGEMEGLPEAYLKAQKRDDEGRYVLGLDYPAYIPFMTNARNEAARKRYFVAKLSEGGEKNLERLDEIFRLRKELALLHGLPSFAHYALRRKMVRTPEAVAAFLQKVRSAVAEVEKREIDELRAEKAKETDRPFAETRIAPWDTAYYQERLRRSRFAIDQEKLRAYFPTAKAIDFMLLVSRTIYGVKFREVKVPVWHEDVRYFDVLEARTGRYLSGFYLDLFPREGKYNHAAAFPIRSASRLAGRTPLSVLVANFNREGLDHEELETLLHEFGHVLHGVLSRADYASHAGTAVVHDFVEAPSRMFEEWARSGQSLKLFAKVCSECPQLTGAELERLREARRFGQGIRYARQWLYATFDMALSTDPQPALAVWKSLEGATALGYVEGTIFPASFSHIASGYAAGYYGYMWSEVLALDMFSAFERHMLDPHVGMRFRREILEQGGQAEAMTLVKRFLGREPSNEAFFAEITGKR